MFVYKNVYIASSGVERYHWKLYYIIL